MEQNLNEEEGKGTYAFSLTSSQISIQDEMLSMPCDRKLFKALSSEA